VLAAGGTRVNIARFGCPFDERLKVVTGASRALGKDPRNTQSHVSPQEDIAAKANLREGLWRRKQACVRITTAYCYFGKGMVARQIYS
jgi:hypothetical protein